MHNDNKSEKPISMGSYLPYRTTIASMAENYNRLNNYTSEINLINLYQNSHKSSFKHFSSIPFKATALGNLSEEERSLLLQELQTHREQEAKKYKVWAKEVESFKQTLKTQESRFVVIDVDNEALVIPGIHLLISMKLINSHLETFETESNSHKPAESEREIISKNRDSANQNPPLQSYLKTPNKNSKPLPHRYMSVVTQRKSSNNFMDDQEAENTLKQKRRNTANTEKIKDFFYDFMKQEKSLWGHSPKSPKKQINLEENLEPTKKELPNKNPTSIILEIPQQTQTSIPKFNKDSRIFTSIDSEDSRTADELSPIPPKDILNLASSNNSQNPGSSSSNSSPDNDQPLSPPALIKKADSQEENENTDPNTKKSGKKFKKKFNRISPEK